MKTQNNKLRFNKNTMVELNDYQLLNIDGGTTPVCAAAAAAAAGSSGTCAGAAGLALGGSVVWLIKQF